MTALPLLMTRYADQLPLVAAPGSAEGAVGPTEAARYLYGAAIVLVLLYAPDGLHGLARRSRDRLRRRRTPTPTRLPPFPRPRRYRGRSTQGAHPVNTGHTRRPRIRAASAVLAGTLALLLAATGCSSKAEGGDKGDAADGVRTGPGVDDDTIRLGALTDLTGPYATLGKSIVQAQQMWADETNAKGGICDRDVEIVVKDHGYDVQKAVTAYADIAPDVVALPQVIGSPVVAALLDDIERDKMLTFPQAWAASLLGKDAVQVLGTTYDVDMIAAVDFLTRAKGLKKGDTIGHVYFEGDYGANALEGSTWAAERAGMKVAGQKIQATDTDLSAQVSALRKEGVKAVLISAGPAQTASLVGVAASRGLKVPVVSNAPGFAPQLMETRGRARPRRHAERGQRGARGQLRAARGEGHGGGVQEEVPGLARRLRRAVRLQRREAHRRGPREGVRGGRPDPGGRRQGAPLAVGRRHRARHTAGLLRREPSREHRDLRAQAGREGGRRRGERRGRPYRPRRRGVPLRPLRHR